jgi:hypothetical protein
MLRRLPWLLPALLVAGACTEDLDTGATIPASQGATQPEGNGVAMSAEDACDELLAAIERWEDRGEECDDTERKCPDYILPAGSSARCTTFDTGSVEACVDVIDKYKTCDDFTRKPCIVTALDVACAAEGAGGAAGSAGSRIGVAGAAGNATEDRGQGGA